MDNNSSQQQQLHPHGAPRSTSTNRQVPAHAVSNAQPHTSSHGVPSAPRLPGEGSFPMGMPSSSSSGGPNMMGGMARGPAASAMRSFASTMGTCSPHRQQQARLPQQTNSLQQPSQRLTAHLHGNYGAVSGVPMATASPPATSWNVPNPLGQSPQQTGVAVAHGVAARSPSRYAQHSANPNALQQQQQQQQERQQQQQQAMQQRMAAAQQQQQQQQQQPPVKKKVVLTHEAKQALARAIWSAIRSPNGQVDPALMQAALKTGLPKHAILNAARLAREREAIKRKERQQQQQQLQQQQRKQGVSGSASPSRPSTIHSQVQQQYLQQQRLQQQQQQQQQKLQQQKLQQQQQKQQKLEQQRQEQLRKEQAQRESEAKIRERSKWKRVQSGVFMVQKNRFVGVPFSVGGMVRASSMEPTLKPTLSARNAMRKHAALVQQKYRQQQQALLMKSAPAASSLPTKPTAQPPQKEKPTPLLNPEKHKRIKMEPKKFSKALDRFSRKSRQALAEGFLKQYKEFNKAISSHHQDFFKFHRQRKADLTRLTKAVRDTFDKEEKKREKDAVQAERARLAALRANDMTAYSQLLEETKNDRLRFLLDKTEKHFTQISSLLQQRVGDDTIVAASAANGQQQPKSYYATAHSKTEEVRQPSILVGGDLKEYQMTGLQWMVSLYNNKLNGILADEMGLGKTIQAIALVSYLMEFKQNLGPFLVIVPLSTLSNWESEFAKWCPAARVIAYKGTPPVRREIYKNNVRTGHFNVLLTTYEYIIRDKKYLKNIEWQYAIVDEGHRMKNAQSKFAVTLSSQYTTNYRILLTGTPLMNDLSELWSLLNFLLPSIFNSVETFDQWFSRPFAQFGGSSAQEEGADALLSNEERVLIIHRLHELLRPFMLRRVKSEVLDQLPEKVEKVLRCHLTSWQKLLYKQISAKAFADSSITGVGAQSRGLNNVVMQLRKVCNHPFLFSPEGYHIGEELIRSSGKIALLDQMLPKLKAAGHRVLMFTQMTAVMTILEDYFAYRGYLSLRLDGSTPAEVREKRMYKFNAPDSPYFIFLLSTRAGGLGLNLTSADTVIIFDSDWNPMMDLQAQDRAHRIGQRSDVSVFRLITYSPVEEKILSRASEKLNMSELVVESGKFNKDSVDSDNSMERKRMMEVLLTDFDTTARGGPSEKSGSDEGDEDEDGSDGSDTEDLNELLSNNETDYQLYTEIDKEREKEGTIVAMYTEEEEVPNWIRYPNAGGASGSFAITDSSNGSRKRKDVAYDDGLTEKQFLRLMEKQATEEENARKKQKTARGAVRTASAAPSTPDADLGEVGGEATLLTDWTFRKLITCSKTVVALKDPSTKRRLSDIFLDKPDPATFPDYYEIIEKPIAINDILRKCRAKMYNNIPEFRADWKLMFANAVKFNGEDSWVVEDAKALEKELERVLKKNGFTDDQKPPTSKKKKKLRIKLSLKDMKAKPGIETKK